MHKLSFIRVYSGTIKKDDSVHVSGARKSVKLHQLLDVQGSETHARRSAGAGEIVAVAKVDELHTGLSLGEIVMPDDQVSHADGRPGRHAQEPRRREQAVRRAAQDRRRRQPRSSCIATRKRTNW